MSTGLDPRDRDRVQALEGRGGVLAASGCATSGRNSLYAASFWIIVVSTVVGQTALTVMPFPATSCATRLDQPDHPPLRRAVVGDVGEAHLPGHRRRRDDPAVALLDHRGQHRAHGVEHAGQVGVDHLLPGAVGHVRDRGEGEDPRVGQEEVDAAELGPRLLGERVELPAVPHVGGDGDAAAVEVLDEAHGLLPGRRASTSDTARCRAATRCRRTRRPRPLARTSPRASGPAHGRHR